MQDFMQDLAFEELLEATMRLKPELRHVLMQLLHVTPAEAGNEDSFLQSEILSEASAYSVFTPLCNVQPWCRCYGCRTLGCGSVSLL